jgi:hypothetical protein
MPIWLPGNQTIGIVTVSPVLDLEGNPVESEKGIKQTTTATVWKTGCVFEVGLSAMPGRAEDVTDLGTTMKQIGWAIFPADPDSTAITVGMQLNYNNRLFDMRGDGITEVDIDGVPSHVFCLCEYQA